jgi:uncharacterized protein YxjI
MRYVMKQKVWAMGDDYTIKDESGQDRFFVDGKVLSIGDKLSFQDMAGHELVFLREKLLSWGPTYELHQTTGESAIVKKKLWTFVRDRFTIDVGADGPTPNDLEIQGDLLDHEYAFTRAGQTIAAVSKKWFSWTDTYGVDTGDGEDDVLILACTVVVDLCLEKEQRNR